MKKIIIGSKFSIPQKLMFVLIFFSTFFIGGISILILILGKYDQIDENIVYKIIYPLLFPVSLYVFALFFSKQGVLFENKKIYSSQFFFGKPFSKKEIDLTGITDISILIFDINQKLPFFSAARPDLAQKIELNKIYLLNENHSKKIFVISTKKSDLAQKVVNEINNEFNFTFKKYSPPRVRRRR